MDEEPEWWPSFGLSQGMTLQFAEGDWKDEITSGITLNDSAFDFVEPLLRENCVGWNSGHRYAIYQLTVPERDALIIAFANRAESLQTIAKDRFEAELMGALADWLRARCDQARMVGILGY